jgi:hypothetical protein
MGVRAVQVDDRAMADADEALRALAEAYPAYALAELDSLSDALARLRTGGTPPADDELFLPAHNLKGQGAAFGYELITTLGDLLCRLVRSRMIETPAGQSTAANVIAACRMVLAQRLTGDGGLAGSKLMSGFFLLTR